eukprot:TRINITY_DN34908_c0_g1_i1.p1 TRINITY_DN34908_c0_g1~~TRINITY_DN34908_c0_g1_i1.p1  ORF type:complete len:1213 (+),score=206.11 TRINITY_DN34908_c0_g1_i1:42-3680(+)
MMIIRALFGLLAVAATVVATWTGSEGTCSSTTYPRVSALKSSLSSPWTSKGRDISVIVYWVAWNDTSSTAKFRIPYTASRTPNFFPKGLGTTYTYGPKLPDVRVNPVARASRFFSQMTWGKITFNATYRAVQLSDNLASYSCDSSCPYTQITENVLNHVNVSEVALYQPSNYDVVLAVFPDETYSGSSGCSPQRYYQIGYRIITYGGYTQFRHNDNANNGDDQFSLFQSLAGLFSVQDSEYWDYARTKSIYRGDRTGLMGKDGLETNAFTNPYNLYKMGVLDNSVDIRTITRTGIYRVWPLYPDVREKGYAYDGSLDTVAASTWTSPQTWQRYRAVQFNPDYVVSGTTVTYSKYYSILWQRNEITYKISSEDSSLRAKYNFSHSLMLHQYNTTNNITGLTQKSNLPSVITDDSITNSSRLVVGESLDSFFSQCKSTVLCRDTTTSPSSFLLDVKCTLANSDVVTGFNTEYPSELTYSTTDYGISYDSTRILNASASVGYFSLAITGTNCAGAAALKASPYLITDNSLANVDQSTRTWYSAFTSGQSISVCYAESDSGGVDDSFFVEQTGVTISKTEYVYSPYGTCHDKAISSCYYSNFGGGSSKNITMYDGDTLPRFTCVDGGSCCCKNSSSTCSSSTVYSRKACCNNRGYVGRFDQYQGSSTGAANPMVGAFCTCDDNTSYTGTYCQSVIGVYLKLSVVNSTKYVGTTFSVYGTVGAYPQSNDYIAECHLYLQNGSDITLGNWTFSATTSGSISVTSTMSFSLTPTSAYYPSVNVSCKSMNSASQYHNNTQQVLTIYISSKKPVTAPTYLRVLSYAEYGSINFGWDAMDGASSYTDLIYQLSYRTYNSSTLQGTWTNVTTNTTSYYVQNMSVGQPYEVVVSSTSASSGNSTKSSSLYVIPINYNSTCSSVGGDSNPKNCTLGANCDATFGHCSTAGDCWCKGWYHGDNCSISGCYYSMDDQNNNKTCSGHGYCNSSSTSDSYASCTCDNGYYGIWCHKLDWYTSAITFDQPTDTTAITQEKSFTVVWNNPDLSLSTGADLYIQYIAAGLASDSASYDNWQYVGSYTYDTSTRKASATISKVTAGNSIPYGSSGYVSFQVRDHYYTNLAATTTATLINPAPTHSPTPSPTPYPTIAPTITTSTGTSSSGLLSGNNKIYVAVVGSVIVLAASAGTAIFCVGRIRRRMYGTHQLQDVGVTGSPDDKATEVAEIH